LSFATSVPELVLVLVLVLVLTFTLTVTVVGQDTPPWPHADLPHIPTPDNLVIGFMYPPDNLGSSVT
jgi:hypothetical protein